MTETVHRKLGTIMPVDMVGDSGLTQGNEALAPQLLEEHHWPPGGAQRRIYYADFWRGSRV
jgi:hypothetical protein